MASFGSRSRYVNTAVLELVALDLPVFRLAKPFLRELFKTIWIRVPCQPLNSVDCIFFADPPSHLPAGHSRRVQRLIRERNSGKILAYSSCLRMASGHLPKKHRRKTAPKLETSAPPTRDDGKPKLPYCIRIVRVEAYLRGENLDQAPTFRTVPYRLRAA